jgi:hypothetical protein
MDGSHPRDTFIRRLARVGTPKARAELRAWQPPPHIDFSTTRRAKMVRYALKTVLLSWVPGDR